MSCGRAVIFQFDQPPQPWPARAPRATDGGNKDGSAPPPSGHSGAVELTLPSQKSAHVCRFRRFLTYYQNRLLSSVASTWNAGPREVLFPSSCRNDDLVQSSTSCKARTCAWCPYMWREICARRETCARTGQLMHHTGVPYLRHGDVARPLIVVREHDFKQRHLDSTGTRAAAFMLVPTGAVNESGDPGTKTA